MKKIDNDYDVLLKSNYDLYKTSLSELKKEVNIWYNYDLTKFDYRNEYDHNDINENLVNKINGIISNQFYAYKDGDSFILLDGYNRLISDIGDLNKDTPVYLKVLTDNLSDGDIMSIMFSLNSWKLSKSGGLNSEFNIHNFLDRGFRLFLKRKYNIEFRHINDFKILNQYFKNENDYCGYFNYKIKQLQVIFKNDKVIDDIKELIKYNHDNKSFGNYENFLLGYASFLSRMRLKGDISEHLFETYCEKLKKDKLFKKLQTMCGNESTRKNIYNFFNQFDNENK